MKYEIKGNPFPVVECHLDANEQIKCQKGAMSWMSSNMSMETKTGGLGKMLTKAVTGESLFENTYTAKDAPGFIAFCVTVPGNIIAVELSSSRSIVAQKSAYLAGSTGVDMSLFFQPKIGAGFLGGEGFAMEKFSGNGTIFLEIDGSVVERELQQGESIVVDTGYVAAMDDTCTMDVKTTGNLKSLGGIGNALFGGEGLFNTTVTGPGHVWLQTMPLSTLAAAVKPFIIPKSSN